MKNDMSRLAPDTRGEDAPRGSDDDRKPLGAEDESGLANEDDAGLPTRNPCEGEVL